MTPPKSTLSIIEPKNDPITWTVAETKNSSQFIHFLEHLLVMQYPTGRVVLVMDNAAYHKSAPSLAALSLFEHRVLVIWLLTYCSELNPIETEGVGLLSLGAGRQDLLLHSQLHLDCS